MFQNFVKIAIRNLTKFKGYAAINIAGLAIGIACCLLIVQYLRIETSYDRHHADVDRLYRVTTDFILGERRESTVTTPSPLAFAMRKDFPEVVQATRVLQAPSVDKFLVKYQDRMFFQDNGLYADSTFFEVLTFPFVSGDPLTALDRPNSVVISAEMGIKIFGSEDPMNRVIELQSSWGTDEYEVTGVFDKDAHRSHIDANFFMSAMTGSVGQRFYQLDEWAGNNMYYTYFKTAPNTDIDALKAKMPDWMAGYAAERLKQLGFSKEHDFETVRSIYLHSTKSYQLGPTGSISYVYLLALVAIFILVIACINFMNLATAKATVRAYEVGVRKVIGASRSSLTAQFMSEILVYATISVVLAALIIALVGPGFSALTGKEIQLNVFQDPVLALWLIAIIGLTTIVAGSYPSLYLSSFSPVKIFRGQFGDKLSAKNIRKGLVAFQFIISIALIQGALIIHQQLEYCKSKDLGFNPEAKLIIPLNTPESRGSYQPLKNKLLGNAGFKQIGATSIYPGKLNIEDMLFMGEGQTSEQGSHSYRHSVDPDYMHLMDFRLVEGRLFSEDRLADTVTSAVITETLVKGLGYSNDNAVGKTMHFNWDGTKYEFNIIGVIKDFHSMSLYRELDGEAFFYNPSGSHNFLVAEIETTDIPTSIAMAEEAWAVTNPSEPFEFYFLDEQLQQNYLASERMNSFILWGTLLAILISCLGLLGLASFAAERRKKEFGVRRVLGASTRSIIGLISSDFLKLVVIALIVASPIAWYMMNNWLNEFHYHISMPWWAFVAAGIAAAVIALVTVTVQTLRSQAINPVESLRSE